MIKTYQQSDVVVSWIWASNAWTPVNSEAWTWNEKLREWAPNNTDEWTWDPDTRMWIPTN